MTATTETPTMHDDHNDDHPPCTATKTATTTTTIATTITERTKHDDDVHSTETYSV